MSESKYFKLAGSKLHYQVHGAGFPIVLVHAGIANLEMWQPQVAVLSPSYQVVTYDMRGYGRSPRTSGNVAHYQDLLALIEYLGLDSYVLVGCSKGGAVAMDAALAAPDRVAGLMVIGGIPHGYQLDGEEPDATELALQRWEESVAASKTGDLERLNELEVQMWVDGFNEPTGRAPVAVREKVREMNLMVLQNEKDIPDVEEQVLEPKTGVRLDELNMPTLFICGALDEPIIQVANQEIVNKMPQAHYVELPGTAHLPNMEQPEAFNQLLIEFVNQLLGN